MISEQSQEIFDALGYISKIKVDKTGATIYNGLYCERLNKKKHPNYRTIAAEVGHLATEAQDRAPRSIGESCLMDRL